MSALLSFAIFPTSKGDSVSEYVSKVIKIISKSNYPYKLNAMGTVVETETVSEALDVIQKSYNILEEFSDRVYITANIDVRKGKTGRIKSKVDTINKLIG